MTVRYCLGLNNEDLARLAGRSDLRSLEKELRLRTKGDFLQALELPSHRWADRRFENRVVAQLLFSSHDQARKFHQALRTSGLSEAGFGADPTLSPLESWNPTAFGSGIFADRYAAEALTGVGALRNATGKGVNVVIVDRGLNRDVVGLIASRMRLRRGLVGPAPLQRVLGWARQDRSDRDDQSRTVFPGSTWSSHGEMTVRNVLAIAPEATIWDAPLLPDEDQPDAPPGPSDASCLFHWIKEDAGSQRIKAWNSQGRQTIVDFERAVDHRQRLGVMDPEEDPVQARYSDDPDHLIVKDLPRISESGIDVVFAAGNCGLPCPDTRCGAEDCGPGRSIFGLNGHPDVLTVGAVRTDGMPMALSAQGPGRLATKQYAKNLKRNLQAGPLRSVPLPRVLMIWPRSTQERRPPALLPRGSWQRCAARRTDRNIRLPKCARSCGRRQVVDRVDGIPGSGSASSTRKPRSQP